MNFDAVISAYEELKARYNAGIKNLIKETFKMDYNYLQESY
jgi:hypothetical protein